MSLKIEDLQKLQGLITTLNDGLNTQQTILMDLKQVLLDYSEDLLTEIKVIRDEHDGV